MYLVFTTNCGHKNKKNIYLQIRNNNDNVYTIKILYNKTVGI